GYCGALLSLPILPSTWKGGFLRRVLPGLLLALACAVAARLIHGALPAKAGALVGEVVVAVLLGLVIGNLVSLPSALAPGIRFSFHTLLRVAIVILGAQFSFMQVVAIGGKAVVMIVVLMTLALAAAHALGRVARVPGRLATLIGVGTAVCGNTAIMGPVIVVIGLIYARGAHAAGGEARRGLGARLGQSIPVFVIGFLVVALLNTVGAIAWLGTLLHRDLAHDLQVVSRFLILVAL